MAGPRLLTAQDAWEFAEQFMAGQGASVNPTQIRTAMQSAYQEVGESFGWSFLYKHGRVQMNAPYETGTVAYDHTGGTYERQLTLTSGTWPTWVEDAVVRIGDENAPHRIESRKSDTVVTLDAMMNPGADIAADTTYTCYQTYYRLPVDFVRMVRPWDEDAWRGLIEVSYDELMARDKYDGGNPSTLTYFCIREVDDLYGQMAIFVYPESDTARQLDFVYQRAPREVRYSGFSTANFQGTVAASAAATTVTGTGTAFNSLMNGSIIRFSSTTARPTGLRGDNPFTEQHSITGVTNTTKLVIDTAMTNTLSGVGYTISDPIDLEYAAHGAYLACLRKWLAMNNSMIKRPDQFVFEYEQALRRAKAADNRTETPRYCGWYRAAEVPFGTVTDRM